MKKLIIVLSIILATTAIGFAQETETSKKEAVQKTVYTCPHHKKMTSNMPGKCSKCQMDLVEVSTLKHNTAVKGSQMSEKKEKLYQCSMCKITSKKAGKCPKCKMEMTLKEDEKEENHNH